MCIITSQQHHHGSDDEQLQHPYPWDHTCLEPSHTFHVITQHEIGQGDHRRSDAQRQYNLVGFKDISRNRQQQDHNAHSPDIKTALQDIKDEIHPQQAQQEPQWRSRPDAPFSAIEHIQQRSPLHIRPMAINPSRDARDEHAPDEAQSIEKQ